MSLKKVKTTKGLEYVLYKEIKRGRLLDINRVPRRIGKTTLLNQIAIDNDYIIVTPTRSLSDYFNHYYGNKRYMSMGEIRTSDFPRSRRAKFLLEEGLDLQDEKYMMDNFNVIGGYSINYKI